jgi:hypothetical protein
MKASYSFKFLFIGLLFFALILGVLGGAIYSPINLYQNRFSTLKKDPRILALQSAIRVTKGNEWIRYNLENSSSFYNCASKNLCDGNSVLMFQNGDQSSPFASFDLNGKACLSDNCQIRIEVEVRKEENSFALNFSLLPLEKSTKLELMSSLPIKNDSEYIDSLDQIAFDSNSIADLESLPSWMDQTLTRLKMKPKRIVLNPVRWESNQVDQELQALDREKIVKGLMNLEENLSEIHMVLKSNEEHELLVIKNSNVYLQKDFSSNADCPMDAVQDKELEPLYLEDPSLLLRNIYSAKICYIPGQLNTPCAKIKVVLNSKKPISIGQDGINLCENPEAFAARISSIVGEAKNRNTISNAPQKQNKF